MITWLRAPGIAVVTGLTLAIYRACFEEHVPHLSYMPARSLE